MPEEDAFTPPERLTVSWEVPRLRFTFLPCRWEEGVSTRCATCTGGGGGGGGAGGACTLGELKHIIILSVQGLFLVVVYKMFRACPQGHAAQRKTKYPCQVHLDLDNGADTFHSVRRSTPAECAPSFLYVCWKVQTFVQEKRYSESWIMEGSRSPHVNGLMSHPSANLANWSSENTSVKVCRAASRSVPRFVQCVP